MNIKLNEKQIDKLADIASDIGLITLATIVLPAAFDRVDLNKLILGSVATLIFWIASIGLKK